MIASEVVELPDEEEEDDTMASSFKASSGSQAKVEKLPGCVLKTIIAIPSDPFLSGSLSILAPTEVRLDEVVLSVVMASSIVPVVLVYFNVEVQLNRQPGATAKDLFGALKSGPLSEDL